MIDGLVSRLLENYVYDYLENFDKQNIKISLLAGKVELNNLELNQKIIENFPFPVKLKYGRVGSIVIRLPSIMDLL